MVDLMAALSTEVLESLYHLGFLKQTTLEWCIAMLLLVFSSHVIKGLHKKCRITNLILFTVLREAPKCLEAGPQINNGGWETELYRVIN